ncbi:MbtH family NRPS accessory protein [Streptomyces alboflavus]|uniref:MbtH family NRPS accessory protein n=1 Tax=Streptomyces alboflavus TaxID=67267 RepID=UPI000A7C5A3D
MSTNPFGDVPDGRRIVFGADERQKCLDHVGEHWTDLRPKSLRRQMAARRGA